MQMDVAEAQMLWLNITNAALGVVVLVCLGVISFSVFQAVLERRRLRAAAMGEVDRDVRTLLEADTHAFDVPGLGLTMADGGEPAKGEKKASPNSKR